MQQLEFKFSRSLCVFIHVVTAFFVFSYLAFDVLDLDLSKFRRTQTPHEKTSVIAEAGKEMEPGALKGYVRYPVRLAGFIEVNFDESIQLQHKHMLRDSRLYSLRDLRRKVLPPASRSDKSPEG